MSTAKFFKSVVHRNKTIGKSWERYCITKKEDIHCVYCLQVILGPVCGRSEDVMYIPIKNAEDRVGNYCCQSCFDEFRQTWRN